MRRLSAAILALGLFAAPSLACINDVELPSHEREFRSQYRRSARPVPLASNAPIKSWALIAGGSILFGGAVVLAFSGRRTRA